MPERAHIGLGANLGDRETHIAEAVMRVDAVAETAVAIVSSLCETTPVGKTDQPDFINAVIEAQTDLAPDALLDHLLAIETTMGRVRDETNGPRVIDLDLLLHGDCVITTERLTLPHPRMAERHFVLVPLVEIAPDLRDPTSGRPWREILDQLPPTDWGRVVGL